MAEMVFPPVVTLHDYYHPRVGERYHLGIITPDERRFLLSPAMEHLQGIEPGAVVGDRVELVVDGKAKIDFKEWQKVYDEMAQRSGQCACEGIDYFPST